MATHTHSSRIRNENIHRDKTLVDAQERHRLQVKVKGKQKRMQHRQRQRQRGVWRARTCFLG
eukprot:1661138-Rhodomonas_salina.1